MLRFHNISLYQFKNYSKRQFAFTEKIVCICGRNGTGKTNLLDAIHYLCFTKSYFTRDPLNVQQGKSGFRIEGQVSKWKEQETAICILRENGKKEFQLNGTAYDKFSQHIGKYPCVVIAPDDALLITGESKERRAFIDSLLSQLDSDYLQNLIVYKKIIEQRNSFLKTWAESPSKDLTLLDILDEQLCKAGEKIFEKRRDFLMGFLPMANHLYKEIAKQPEDITLFYNTDLLSADYKSLLTAARVKDLNALRTTCGVHKDDIEINMGQQLFKTMASQGQRKSLLFALKLAEMEVLQKEKKFAPVLLLDDIFEKLDEDRISNLLHKVCVENDGQVFITDTSKERLSDHLEELKVPYQIIEIDSGF